MPRTFLGRRARWAVQGFLLLAVVLRAFIPVGYMPSADRPFTLQLCPDGLPRTLLPDEHAHHHAGSDSAGPGSDTVGSGDSGSSPHESFSAMHCVFAAVAGATPPAYQPATAVADSSAPIVQRALAAPVQAARHGPQQARAPPHLS